MAVALILSSTVALARAAPVIDEATTPPDALEETSTTDAPEGPERGLGFGGIPVLSFNSDDGIGFGAIGSLFWNDSETLPFKYQLRLQVFFTSKGINAHDLRFEGLRLFDLPLRVVLRAGFYSSISQNFCGFGNTVTCSRDDARAAADARGLGPVDAGLTVTNYYKHRFLRPNVVARARWAFNQKPHQVELMAAYRGYYYQPGQLFADGQLVATTPFAGSKISEVFGEDGAGRNGSTSQQGLASVIQVGVMVDNRDNEPSPTRGYWVEASARASTFLWGSSWNYAGVNLTGRFYYPVDSEGKLVIAQRLIFDATVGDLPVQEMIRVGGSSDLIAYGGLDFGRGIRVQRNIGRIKLIDTTEVRWRFFDYEVFGQRFDHALVGFVDAGWIGLDWTDFGGDPLRLNIGFGGGFRVAWNDNFVIRIDAGVSSEEQYAPGFYVAFGQTF